jgi:hypothetical protein
MPRGAITKPNLEERLDEPEKAGLIEQAATINQNPSLLI